MLVAQAIKKIDKYLYDTQLKVAGIPTNFGLFGWFDSNPSKSEFEFNGNIYYLQPSGAGIATIIKRGPYVARKAREMARRYLGAECVVTEDLHPGEHLNVSRLVTGDQLSKEIQAIHEVFGDLQIEQFDSGTTRYYLRLLPSVD